jgi:group I intron endonuclease
MGLGRITMTIGIYKITNTVNGKCYVGQSWNIESRWRSYHQLMCRGQTKLFNAFKKHGLPTFTFEMLTEYASPGPTQDELDTREDYWMEHFQCIQQGYNIRQAGSRGKFSDASKEKMRQAHLGKTQSDATKEKHRLASTGRKHTAEAKANMSAVQKGRVVSSETRAKLREIQTGKTYTSEVKARMGDIHRGSIHTEETKALMSAVHLGKSMSADARVRMSEFAKLRCQRQEKEGTKVDRRPVPESFLGIIRELYAKGTSMRSIAKQTGFGYTSVRSHLLQMLTPEDLAAVKVKYGIA